MSYRIQHKYCRRAFSLVEATTSLIILAFISSSVLVVINRCVAATADSVLRMQAFGVVYVLSLVRFGLCRGQVLIEKRAGDSGKECNKQQNDF